MKQYPKPLAKLIGELSKLPGIGYKSAQRLAFHILDYDERQAQALADAITCIIYGREQDLISPIQSKRLLNTFNARLVKFVSTLRRLGFDVEAGEDEYGNANLDDSTIIVSWE